MPDPFESSRRKIAWAKKNFADFDRECAAWFGERNYAAIFIEPHPNKPNHFTHKLRMTKQIPEVWPDVVGTIIDSLRAALDHATYGLAITSGNQKPLNAYFPFSRDATTFETNLKGRCADVPKEIYPLLRSFKPYKGGNERLWAVNEVCVANKHKILIPIGSATFPAGVDFSGSGFIEMPSTHVWDRTKHEMELFTLGPQTTKFNGDFKFGCYIAFGEIGSLAGEPAIPVLDQFVNMVETILGEIEAESRRLGFIQ